MKTIRERIKEKLNKRYAPNKDACLIFDFSPIIYQAFFACCNVPLSGLRNALVLSVLSEIVSIAEATRIGQAVFCFDSKTSKRKKIYPLYKSGRRDKCTPQELKRFAIMDEMRTTFRKNILPRIGFQCFVKKGLESDDLIAAIVYEKLGDFVIVSTDKDLWQLLACNVKQLNPNSGEMMTMMRLLEDKGVTPGQWRKVKAIGGCAGDRVPGCAEGIGEGRAIKYVKGQLKEPWVGKIERAKKQLKLNIKLTQLPFQKISLPIWESNQPSCKNLNEVLQEYGIHKQARLMENFTSCFVE